ncbi:MAG TPA: hypothetical protein VH600_11125 [Burkholderiales bacterium]|jgi:hypothetical protein
MARRKKSSVSRDETAAEPILKRPDGFYWQRKSGDLRGPFVTRAEAEADRLAGGAPEDEFQSGESLQEAESEIGMAEWIDPDTGGPAEDSVPRIEDH